MPTSISRADAPPQGRLVAWLAVLGGLLTSGIGLGLALTDRSLLARFGAGAIWGLGMRRACLVGVLVFGLLVGVVAARLARRGRLSDSASVLWSYSLLGFVIALPSIHLAQFFLRAWLPFALAAVLALRDGRRGGTKRVLAGLAFWLVVAAFANLESVARRGALWAVSGGHPALLDAMGTAGVPVDLPDEQGRTPLMIAVEASDAETIDILMAHGASPYRRDGSGRSAMMRAVDQESPAIAERLLSAMRRRLEAARGSS